MAVIENMATAEAQAEWRVAMETMSHGELMAQQLVQRGAEHALAWLVGEGATPERAASMLASVRSGLVVIHEVAHKRGIDLIGYQS